MKGLAYLLTRRSSHMSMLATASWPILVLALSLLVLTILQLRITRKDLESRAGRGDG